MCRITTFVCFILLCCSSVYANQTQSRQTSYHTINRPPVCRQVYHCPNRVIFIIPQNCCQPNYLCQSGQFDNLLPNNTVYQQPTTIETTPGIELSSVHWNQTIYDEEVARVTKIVQSSEAYQDLEHFKKDAQAKFDATGDPALANIFLDFSTRQAAMINAAVNHDPAVQLAKAQLLGK